MNTAIKCGNCKASHGTAAAVKECYIAERDRLVALKAWGPRLAEVERGIKDQQPVELAQDAYYYGTAADFSQPQQVPASDKQVAYLRTLLEERDHAFVHAESVLAGVATSKQAASAMIKGLLELPKVAKELPKVKGQDAYEPQRGDVHYLDDTYYRVHVAQHSGHLYACKWEDGKFRYAKGAVRRLRNDTIVTAEQAAAFGHMTEQCVFCSHAIDTPESTKVGYGPVCAANRGLPWGN